MKPPYKPFDLEQAKAGKPIMLRNGQAVTYLGHAKDLLDSERVFSYAANGVILRNAENGISVADGDTSLDLVMAPVKTKYWVNVYPRFENSYVDVSIGYATESEALRRSEQNCTQTICIEVDE